MREFLLCILICCLSHLAFGQFIYYPNDKSKGSFTEQIEKHVKEKMDEFTIAAVRLWDEYSAECWADSTKRESKRYYQKYCDSDGKIQTIEITFFPLTTLEWMADSTTTETYYTHRDPTFPGFMKFLKRKVKP